MRPLGELPMAAYDKALEMGLHCMEIPEEFGGGGIDYMTVAAACEEMGKVDAGFATTMGATGLAIKPGPSGRHCHPEADVLRHPHTEEVCRLLPHRAHGRL